MDELAQVLGEPETLTVAGETLTLAPLTVGQLPTVLRQLAPIWTDLSGGSTLDWLQLFAQHGHAVLAAMAVAVNRPRSWIDALPPDEALKLAVRLLAINADFFTQRVLPLLSTLLPAGLPAVSLPSAGLPGSEAATPASGFGPASA